MRPLQKFLVVILALGGLSTSAFSDVLLIETVEASKQERLPDNGLSMSTVERSWGAPTTKHNAVGEPPITRWQYDGYSVYFEYDKVITAVCTDPFHHSGLKPLKARYTDSTLEYRNADQLIGGSSFMQKPTEPVSDNPRHDGSSLSQQSQNWLADQPWEMVECQDTEIILLGTAHVSKISADIVLGLLQTGDFDAVAVELCDSRLQALTDKDAWRNTDILAILKSGKASMFLASLVLSGYQKRLAKQFDIEPGAEMRAAIESSSKSHDLELLLIDREIGTTMKRVSRKISFWQRFMLINGLIASVFSRETIEEEEIEQLKQGDILTSAFTEFAETSPTLYQTLIAERDEYMAAKLKLAADKITSNKNRQPRLLAVIGAGHLQGTTEHLEQLNTQSRATIKDHLQALETIPPAARWPKLIPWLIVLLIISGFVIGFNRSPELGWKLVSIWVLINGSLCALGALLARGHIITILAAFIAAPITSLNPTIGAGIVTALVEAWVRKPRVADLDNLRDDVSELKGWWQNRVARILLVFFFSTLGSAAATWIAGLSIVKQLT